MGGGGGGGGMVQVSIQLFYSKESLKKLQAFDQ